VSVSLNQQQLADKEPSRAWSNFSTTRTRSPFAMQDIRVTVEFSQWFLPGQVQDHPRATIGAGSMTARVPILSSCGGAAIPVLDLGAGPQRSTESTGRVRTGIEAGY
jgi:hypothetical protein